MNCQFCDKQNQSFSDESQNEVKIGQIFAQLNVTCCACCFVKIIAYRDGLEEFINCCVVDDMIDVLKQTEFHSFDVTQVEAFERKLDEYHRKSARLSNIIVSKIQTWIKANEKE